MTVVDVELFLQSVLMGLAIHLTIRYAQTVTLSFDRFNFDDGIDGRIVVRTRLCYQFHLLDVSGTQPVQFRQILQLFTVDIDNRRALAEHLITALLLDKPRHPT